MEKDIVQVDINILIPRNKWLQKVNNQYPDLDVRILSNYVINDNRGILLLQISGLTIKKLADDLEVNNLIISKEILHLGDEIIIVNIKLDDPWILNTLKMLELFVSYPILVKNGRLYMKLIAERAKIDLFIANLEEHGIESVLRSIGNYKYNIFLNNKQIKTIEKALKLGYFDIPRRITLTQFANKLNISPSALSERLRRIYRDIAKKILN
jgi:predicted DNA binding protein